MSDSIYNFPGLLHNRDYDYHNLTEVGYLHETEKYDTLLVAYSCGQTVHTGRPTYHIKLNRTNDPIISLSLNFNIFNYIAMTIKPIFHSTMNYVFYSFNLQ